MGLTSTPKAQPHLQISRDLLSPPRETSCHWRCARSPQSHCCVPSGTPPSRLWISRAGQHHSQSSRLWEGWPLKGKGREQKVSFTPWGRTAPFASHEVPDGQGGNYVLTNLLKKQVKTTGMNKWGHSSSRTRLDHHITTIPKERERSQNFLLIEHMKRKKKRVRENDKNKSLCISASWIGMTIKTIKRVRCFF